MKLQKVFFLDRDGVLCEYREYLSRLEDFIILPRSMQALKILKDADYQVYVLTNQPMVARGMISKEVLHDMHDRLKQAARMAGGLIQEILYCPHTEGPAKPGYLPELTMECACRKPKIGMFTQARGDLEKRGFALDLPNSWMVGDSWRDIGLGKTAGLKTAGVRGVPSLEHESLKSKPDIYGQDLYEIVTGILK